MGVFDQNSLKYNDAIPNISEKDGIDLVKCDNTECSCRDINGYCLYETCIIDNPTKIKYHTEFTHKCAFCHKIYTTDTINEVPWMAPSYYMCPECISKISNLLGGD